MYIVRRSFRGPHGPVSAGSVVEPADIKDFKYRLQQQHIVEVNEHNFERYEGFFKARFCAQIPALTVDAKPETVVEEPATPVAAPAKAAAPKATVSVKN